MTPEEIRELEVAISTHKGYAKPRDIIKDVDKIKNPTMKYMANFCNKEMNRVKPWASDPMLCKELKEEIIEEAGNIRVTYFNHATPDWVADTHDKYQGTTKINAHAETERLAVALLYKKIVIDKEG